MYRLHAVSQTQFGDIWDNPRMPTYVYQASTDAHCERCEAPFDQRQKLDEPRLHSCPACGAPLRRIITAPNLAKSSPNLSEDNIAKHGFTQYRKTSKGKYKKTAGKGPDIITDSDD